MSRARASRPGRTWTVVLATAAVVAAGMATSTTAGADPGDPELAPGITTSDAKLSGAAGATTANGLPAGVPKKGTYSFLLQLDTAPTATVQRSTQRQSGAAAGKAAAKRQLSRIRTQQGRVAGDLPGASRVLYRTHSALSGIAVRTNVANYDELTEIDGVTAVYPIAPKKPTNSYAVPFQAAPQAWQAYGDRGQNATVAIIDTGIDYTHTDFGGAGTDAAFEAAGAAGNQQEPTDFPTDKVVGGYDLVGDDYNADPTSETYQPVPKPDNNPLDCNGHGSHVAGSAAGLGVNADGTTYTGAYDTDTPFEGMKIGPGMAPEAKLYAFRVFGCDGSTDVTGLAVERTIDPNGDGDTSDAVDVANLSLGSDFTSPQDGDTVLVDKASAAGVTMVISSGNNGDLYDTGGSPGNARSALTVAASQDAQAVVDALNITAPAAAQYPAERSIAYDWGTKPDLAGNVYKLSSANPYGCQPLTGADATNASGKVVFVEWNDAAPECGSVARSGNIAAAGGIGFIFGSNAENFSAGITGSAVIPGVLVAKSGADAIRTQLTNGQVVTVGRTEANGVKQEDDSLNDTLTDFSSRGIRGADNVKPDVTAVGGTVFSAAVGTGTDGVNESGTSMAAPMTAGLAGLVASQHPDWSAEQIKANIMNTAGNDVTTEAFGDGGTYAPNRVGTGRIDAKRALDNDVLAYVTGAGAGGTSLTGSGVVSASFGTVAVTSDTSQQRTILVQNTGLSTRSYDVGYLARTEVPGVTYTVSPETVSIPARSSVEVTLTMSVDYEALTKTIDPTVDRETAIPTADGSVDVPREYVADASGLVTLTSGDSDVPSLRVPVYSAPRPASNMTQAASITMPAGKVQTALLPLKGQRVNQGSGAENVTSIVAGFGLQRTSPKLGLCAQPGQTQCVHFPDEYAADLRRVGATSSAPQLRSVGENPFTSPNGLAYFAVNTWGPWRSPAGFQDAEVYIDSTGDGAADVVTYSTRVAAGADQTDIMVAETVDLTSGDVLDVQPINDRFGDTDTALFDSDTLVLPVGIGALPGITAQKSRIRYVVEAYSGASAGAVDSIGQVEAVGGDLQLRNAMSTDLASPAISVAGSYNGDSSPLLYADSPGTVLRVRRDAASYAADGTKGVMMVHFHNLAGSKSQVVSVAKGKSAARLSMAPNPATSGRPLNGTVRVTSADGVAPTGTVTFRRLNGPARALGTVKVVNGTARLTFTPQGKGRFRFQAVYSGDGYNAGSSSNIVTVTVR